MLERGDMSAQAQFFGKHNEIDKPDANAEIQRKLKSLEAAKSATDKASKDAERKSAQEVWKERKTELQAKYGASAEILNQLLNTPKWLNANSLKTNAKELSLKDTDMVLERKFQGWVGDEDGQNETLVQALVLSKEQAQAIQSLLDAPDHDRNDLQDALNLTSAENGALNFLIRSGRMDKNKLEDAPSVAMNTPEEWPSKRGYEAPSKFGIDVVPFSELE